MSTSSSTIPDGVPYTISPFSPLTSCRFPSAAYHSYTSSSLSLFTTISYALYDQFLHLISSIDAQLNSPSHRAMLRTVTDSVRDERDRFTQYLTTHQHLPPSPTPPPFDPLDLYRLQRRLQLHYTVWNRAIAELYAFCCPVKGVVTGEVVERMEGWMRVMEERKERWEWEEVEAQAKTRNPSTPSPPPSDSIELKDLTHPSPSSPTTPSSPLPYPLDSTDFDAVSTAPLSVGSVPSTPLTGSSLSPDVSSMGAGDSGDEAEPPERSISPPTSSPQPSSRPPLHPDTLNAALQATLAYASNSLAPFPDLRHSQSDDSSLSAQAVQLPSPVPLSSSTSAATLPSPSMKPLPPPPTSLARSRSRSSSPMQGGGAPLSFLSSSLFPSLNLLPSIPQVGPESLFSSISPYPSSSVDFLRPSPLLHYDLPLLPHSLPLFVAEDEPSSIIAYTLASIDHLLAVHRLTPQDIPILRYHSMSLSQRDTPSYLLPSQCSSRPSSAESSSFFSRKASTLHVQTNYPHGKTEGLASSPWFKGDHTPGSAVSPADDRSPQVEGSSDALPGHLTLDALYGVDEKRDTTESMERALCSDERHHLKVTFEDLPAYPSSTPSFPFFSSHADKATFTCTAFFPVQFHALRLFCCGGDRPYMTSLARASKWSTTAGKSGSTFAKTRDDRFVLKFVKRQQLTTLLDITLSYCQHMAHHAYHQLPSFIVPILGAYEVGWKKGGRGGERAQCYVVVMSHLFADHTPSIIFDLKGSTKNRYVKRRGGGSIGGVGDEEGGEGSTLMDDNLTEMTGGEGLLLTESSRAVVRMGVANDTLWLSSLGIVDYSILLGLDPLSHHMVIGVIDYGRVYSSVERLETSLKSMGGKEPTVIPPQAYKQRFRGAMDRFFGLGGWEMGVGGKGVGAGEKKKEEMEEEAVKREADGSGDRKTGGETEETKVITITYSKGTK